MKFKKLLPVWYDGGIGNNRNTLYCSIGHLSLYGLYIILKAINYECTRHKTTVNIRTN